MESFLYTFPYNGSIGTEVLSLVGANELLITGVIGKTPANKRLISHFIKTCEIGDYLEIDDSSILIRVSPYCPFA